MGHGHGGGWRVSGSAIGLKFWFKNFFISQEFGMFDFFPVSAKEFDGPVLVTGAGGCIGSWTLALLEHAGV